MSATTQSHVKIVIGNTSVEIPAPPKLEGLNLLTPQQVISNKSMRLLEVISHRLAADPLCQDGRGFYIEGIPVYESQIIEAIQKAFEPTNWELQYTTMEQGGPFLRVVLRPAYLRDWLRQKIIQETMLWNFNLGPYSIRVDGLDTGIVNQVLGFFTRQEWTCRIEERQLPQRDILVIDIKPDDFAHLNPAVQDAAA